MLQALREDCEAVLALDPSVTPSQPTVEVQELIRQIAPLLAVAGSDERYRQLLESVPDVLYELSLEGTVTYISPQVRRYGLEPEELVGRSFLEAILPEDRPKLAEEFEETVSTGRIFPSEFRVQGAEGQVTWFEEHGVLLGGSDPVNGRLAGILRNIDERKHAEQLAFEHLARYRRLFETVSDAIVVLDAETRQFLDVNEAAVLMYGYSHEEFLQLKQRDITAEPEATEESIRATLRGELLHIDLRYHRRKDGTVFPVEISACSFEYAGRTALCGIIRDVTARLHREEQLERHRRHLRALTASRRRAEEQERRRIADGLHDEIAPLLVACRLKIGLLRQQQPAPASMELLGEIDDLLSLVSAKNRALTFELGTSTFYALGLREALAELCERMAANTQVDFQFVADGDPRPLKTANALLIYRAACELVVNVTRHAQADRAWVNLSQTDGHMDLTITDNGVGFNAKDAGRGVSPTGGFGLFRLRESVNEVSGSLRIESIPDDGARVHLSVPVAQAIEETD